MSISDWIVAQQNRSSAWIAHPDRGARAVLLLLPRVAVGVLLFAWFQITNLLAQLRWPMVAAARRLLPDRERSLLEAPDEPGALRAFLATKPIVLLEFSAEWCGPCVLMEGILTQFAANRPDLVVAKLDVSMRPAVARAYGVRAAPTLLLVVDGEEIGRHAGALPSRQLAAWVDSTLSPEGGTRRSRRRTLSGPP